jgi:hypothetical protein
MVKRPFSNWMSAGAASIKWLASCFAFSTRLDAATLSAPPPTAEVREP